MYISIFTPQVQACTGLPVIQEESFHPSSSGSDWEDEGSQGEDVVGGKGDAPNDAASDQVRAVILQYCDDGGGGCVSETHHLPADAPIPDGGKISTSPQPLTP